MPRQTILLVIVGLVFTSEVVGAQIVLEGPATGRLGTVAQVRVPEVCRFTDAKGATHFMQATGNAPSGREQGLLFCHSSAEDSSAWFVLFTYNETGLVPDDDKSSIDQDALLAAVRRQNDASNATRRQHGWSDVDILGWEEPPHYDSVTHNFTWTTHLRDADSAALESFNHSVRFLGRGGVMNVDLVADMEHYPPALPVFNRILEGYAFVPGERYSDWHAGDKVAEYGLAALISGEKKAPARVTTTKLGLFSSWKTMVGVALALLLGALLLRNATTPRRSNAA
jgi:uncharacterized membrane-anchored protein